MTQPQKKTLSRAAIAAVAACLALLLVGGGGGWAWHQANAVASIVSLDVNPSIELTVNGSGKVLSCSALNSDAAQVLFDMDGGADLKGIKVDVAVNAIVGALLRYGYLEDISSAILISVEDKDPARAARLESELTGTVGAALQAQSANAAVLSQTVDAQNFPAAAGSMTHEGSISTGKAYLIWQILDRTPNLSLDSTTAFDRLAAMSVEELNELIQAGYPGIPIGSGAAVLAVDTYAGTTALSSVWCDADLELDENPPCYEVELHTAWGDFDYRVDAFTGEILNGPKDIWNPPTTDDPTPAPDTSTDIGQDTAKAAALKHAGLSENQVSGMKIERDWDDGVLEYEIEFWQGNVEYEYTIDGATGAVVKYQREDRSPANPGGTAIPPSATDIGQDAAKAAALQHAGLSENQVSGMKIERDWDDGVLEYEIEFWRGNVEYEYTIDGATGAVLQYEWDDPGETGGTAPQTLVGENAAMAAALRHAGCREGDTSYCHSWLEYDDGRMECYKVEFCVGNSTYEYEIGLYDCAVLRHGCQTHHNSHHHQNHHGSWASASADIGQDAAKAAALQHAGLSESQVSNLKVEQDWYGRWLEYEVEFTYGSTEYEYTIDGATGAVLDYEWDD